MNRKLLSITVVAMAIAGVALAAVSIPAPGTICVKLAKMGHTFIPVGATNGIFAPTNGQITAQVGQPIQTPDGRSGFNFGVIDFKSTGTVTGLGDVSLTLDTSRRPEPSTFIANTSGQDNTQTINFFLNASVNGRQYRSAGQVTLVGTSVASFPPPPGTAYALTTKVSLVDSAGKVAFTLPVGQAATIQ
jgi:hypothetical protein